MKKLIFLTSLVLIALTSCKKDNPVAELELESIKFKQSSYKTTENVHLNLRNEVITTPAGIIDTAKIIWNIDNEAIAKMSGDFLIPKQPGEVKVTATIQGKSAQCEVVIGAILESISFKQSSYTIAEDYNDFNLRDELITSPAGIRDTARVQWNIDDETIAEMCASYLVPLWPGNVKVTATIQGKSATCDVTITAIPIEDFEITDFSVQKNGTAQVPLTVKPLGISHKRFVWKVSDETIAMIDQNGVVTGLREGTTIVTATEGNKSKTCNLTVD